MTSKGTVLVVAPNTQSRFVGGYLRRDMTLLMAKTLDYATLRNLSRAFSEKDGTGNLPDTRVPTNPMAGYYLESFLRQVGYDVRVSFDSRSDDDLRAALDCDPLAIALSTTFVHTPDLLLRCVQALRRIAGTVPIVVGGPLIWKQSVMLARARSGHDDLSEFGVDRMAQQLFCDATASMLSGVVFVASEFGEHTLLRVLQGVREGHTSLDRLRRIPNLVLVDEQGHWQTTVGQPEPVDLDRDYTRWNLVDQMPPHAAPIRTTVGCPCRCGFCDYHALHPGVRLRRVASMREEVALAHARGCTEFCFVDDDVLVSEQRIGELTRGICSWDIDIAWAAYFRVDRINEGNVRQIYQTGCRAGFCGVESGDAQMLRRMRKGTDPDQIRRGVDLANEVGISTVLGLIVGYPGETRESLDSTITLLNGLDITRQAFSSFRIAPLSVPALSPLDTPALRRRYGLHGRDRGWSHATMTAEEAMGTWSDYLFEQVHKLPYAYVPALTLRRDGESLPASDNPPGLDTAVRNEAFRQRKLLTSAFLGQASDEVVQSRFARLHASLCRNHGPAPPWQQVLADRSVQPGADGRRRGVAMALSRHGRK